MIEKQISMDDKEKIEYICRKYGNFASSHSFASLYIWRETMGNVLCIGEDVFSVKCDVKGENAWFFPCGKEEDKINFIKNKMNEKDFLLCYMRECDKEFLNKNFPGQFEIQERQEDSEYLYDREAWEKLEGRKYATQRNHIRRAEKDNHLTVKNISEEDVDTVFSIISRWENGKHEEGVLGLTDEHSARELMCNYDALSVFGIIVYVNDSPYSVVAGFPLSENMFDMCLAKQKSNLSGLSAYAKYQFISNIDKKYKFINAEEDMGIDGLRIMKKQMQPIDQIKMFDGRALQNEKA